jgi:hypothetical protein
VVLILLESLRCKCAATTVCPLILSLPSLFYELMDARIVACSSLCILQSRSISVYECSAGGVGAAASHSVQLPCAVRAMWPLLEGVLLERVRLPEETTPNPMVRHRSLCRLIASIAFTR